MGNHDAILMISDSERDANLYYASGFFAPDPFIYLQLNDGERILVMSDLEIDRAKAQSKVKKVLPETKYKKISKDKGVENPIRTDILQEVVLELGLKSFLVPADFPIQYTDFLREKGYRVEFKKDPFLDERAIKTEEEIQHIRRAFKYTQDAMSLAIDMIRDSKIKNGYLSWEENILTSEMVKKAINLKLLEDGLSAQHTIVAGGDQGCDPHNQGTGPLRANQTVIIDIFPKDNKSGYFADITRTVVKGYASDELKKMYQAVLGGQEIVFKTVKDGADSAEIHKAVKDSFEAAGFETGEKDGRMQGFFHGTGHGLGLEIHEPPGIPSRGTWGNILKSGNVVTVEPGLYYTGVGGIRVEDVIVVTENGYENLTSFSKELEV